jgi:hypothetical protein
MRSFNQPPMYCEPESRKTCYEQAGKRGEGSIVFTISGRDAGASIVQQINNRLSLGHRAPDALRSNIFRHGCRRLELDVVGGTDSLEERVTRTPARNGIIKVQILNLTSCMSSGKGQCIEAGTLDSGHTFDVLCCVVQPQQQTSKAKEGSDSTNSRQTQRQSLD